MDIVLPDKLYYTIGEIAKAFNVNASLIRFWEKEFSIISPRKTSSEKEFSIISPRKTSSGSRKFSPDDVKKLQLIYHLVKEQGYTLEGARQRLKEDKQKPLTNLDVLTKLERVKQMLIDIKENLE